MCASLLFFVQALPIYVCAQYRQTAFMTEQMLKFERQLYTGGKFVLRLSYWQTSHLVHKYNNKQIDGSRRM